MFLVMLHLTTLLDSVDVLGLDIALTRFSFYLGNISMEPDTTDKYLQKILIVAISRYRLL